MRRDFAAFRVSEGRLESWRLAKSLARSRIWRAKIAADPRPKSCNVSHFGVSVPRKNRVTTALKANAERGRDRGDGVRCGGSAWRGSEHEHRRENVTRGCAAQVSHRQHRAHARSQAAIRGRSAWLRRRLERTADADQQEEPLRSDAQDSSPRAIAVSVAAICRCCTRRLDLPLDGIPPLSRHACSFQDVRVRAGSAKRPRNARLIGAQASS
jgi:hypothetical protein